MSEDRNRIEKLTIAVLTHLPTSIVFVHDPSEECGMSMEKQVRRRERGRGRGGGREGGKKGGRELGSWAGWGCGGIAAEQCCVIWING